MIFYFGLSGRMWTPAGYVSVNLASDRRPHPWWRSMHKDGWRERSPPAPQRVFPTLWDSPSCGRTYLSVRRSACPGFPSKLSRVAAASGGLCWGSPRRSGRARASADVTCTCRDHWFWSFMVFVVWFWTAELSNDWHTQRCRGPFHGSKKDAMDFINATGECHLI